MRRACGAFMTCMLAACGQQPTTVAPTVPQVRIAQVGGTSVPDTIIATGTVAWRHETSLGFTSAGRIATMAANEGDSVRSGQLLAALDTTTVAASVSAARAERERVIPLGTFGGIVALLLTGYSMSFLAIIGFVALIGIEIKNSILLVDFTTQLRDRGLPLRGAIEKAGEIRFLPVLLTSVTAIGGLLPLALGGSALYSPLAWVIIGGLVSSTLLSRIITPVMYLLAARGGVVTLTE